MIDHLYKDLYNEDSIDKQLKIEFEDGVLITNEELYSDSVEIVETLCSENELRFGCCESNQIKFKIANVFDGFKDKWITVSEVLSNNYDNTFLLGKYKVFSDTPSGDRNYREIVAYDALYDIMNADVASWYESLGFPITQKDFRDSFFEYFEIGQKQTTLIHDDMLIEKTIIANSISGKEILVFLCELNGVFGNIERSGKFEYVSLDKDEEYIPIEIDASLYKYCEYDDFVTSNISKLQIRQDENDIGCVYGNGDNCYVIENNYLVSGKSSEEMITICQKLFEKISKVSYMPFKATVKGNPCYTVGDSIIINSKHKVIQSHMLERRLLGIQSLFDDIEAKGFYKYSENSNSVTKDIARLKNKTNVLERTVEKTRSEIADVETGLLTEIEQSAENIKIQLKKEITVGARNLILNSRTLKYKDYFFEQQEGTQSILGNGIIGKLILGG